MRYKSEANENFEEFKTEVEKQISKNILTLRLNQGEEYLSQEFLDYLTKNKIMS